MNTRQQLEIWLFSATPQSLQDSFAEPWLNARIPGLADLIDCSQGTHKHCEGDVARHTALVFQHLCALAPDRLGREADFIERLAVVFHDLKKPATRIETADGPVRFPGHEALSAEEARRLAPELGLSSSEAERLEFLVAEHGNAHLWAKLPPEPRRRIAGSPWRASLALLQEADARACLFPDGSHLPVYFDAILQAAP
jgi:HD domain-containing protein